MLRGDFTSAWQESDFIASTGYQDPHCFWNGESWAGKIVILRCLHGLGDTIQFIRYAPLLRSSCRQLIVQAPSRLLRLLAQVPGVDRAVTWGQLENEWDIQIEVTELPRIFRTRITNIPARVPYVAIEVDTARWAEHIVTEQRALKVGLIWRAGTWDERRSVRTESLLPLLDTQGCKFYALQKDTNDALPVEDVERHAVDAADTAALMCQMDLIISVDTMTAHLAGALGRPTWLLLPSDADWRWMEQRRDSPWYPTMRLFRQIERDDWRSPLEEVCRGLRTLAGNLSLLDRAKPIPSHTIYPIER